MTQTGRIICLNGVSSAGKTSLYKALRDGSRRLYHLLQLDAFFNMTDGKLWQADRPAAIKLSLEMLHRTAALYAGLGHNVVIDQVQLLEAHLPSHLNFLNILRGYPVLMVHVACPADELRRREKARGDRQIGQAEFQLPMLWPQEGYDLTVDTHQTPLPICAAQIDGLADRPAEWWAFEALCRQHLDTL